MPIAALPDYIGKQDLSIASPGMRFGFYLPVWTSRSDQEQEVKQRAARKSPEAREISEYLKSRGMDATIDWLRQRDRNPLPGLWAKNKNAADRAWKDVCKLQPGDKAALAALASRQQALFSRLDPNGSHALSAESIAPFTTGLGNEHPLENGFAFLWPYGLPYLPGSGVKGVLRQAARELAEGIWGDTRGWTEDAITVLFGSEDSNEGRRGALAFWDVIPQIRGNELAVEVMTPHQSHYYRGEAAPHDSGQPVPIYFLTMPPGSGFDFYVTCNPALLEGTAVSASWRELLQAAFEQAFDWLGFGAKTAAGYGAMRLITEAEKEQQQASRKAASLQCPWVDETIAELAEKHHANPQEVLRGKALAGAWQAIGDETLKQQALADIRARWEREGWWSSPPGNAAKKARNIYAEHEAGQ